MKWKSKSLAAAGLFLLFNYSCLDKESNAYCRSPPKMVEQSLSSESDSFSCSNSNLQGKINDVVRYLKLRAVKYQILETVPVGDRKIFVHLRDDKFVAGVTKEVTEKLLLQESWMDWMAILDIAFEDYDDDKRAYGEIDLCWHRDSDTKGLTGKPVEQLSDAEKKFATNMYEKIIDLFYEKKMIDDYLKTADDLEETIEGYKELFDYK